MFIIAIARREARGCGVAKKVLNTLRRDEPVVHFTKEEQANKDWAFGRGIKSCYYRFIGDEGVPQSCQRGWN